MKKFTWPGSRSAVKLSSSDTTALTAVALQDHLTRHLNLTSSDRRPIGLPRSNKPKAKVIKSVVDTGRGDVSRNAANKPTKKLQKEYVLDQNQKPLTLAQKLGLVECAENLTEEEWKKVKAKSNEREDSKMPCVICKEDFGCQEQVLLSCTHVYHKACIQAFERFTGKKSCPMCRKEHYQTRVIYEGATYYHHKCAARIQALWRGYVVKRWYQKLRETVPPSDPLLRKKFYEKKLQSINDRMMQSLDCDVDGFLNDLDKSLAQSRDVFRHFDTVTHNITEEQWEIIQLQAVDRGCADCPICLTPLESSTATADTQTANISAKPANSKDTKKYQNGPSVFPKSAKTQNNFQKQGSNPTPKSAKERSKMTAQNGAGKGPSQSGEKANGASKRNRVSILLSCSHVFHQACLETFEEYSGGNTKACPVCRSSYQKKVF